MKIKSKLFVLVGTTLLLMIFIATSVTLAHRQIDLSLKQQNFTAEILEYTADLVLQLQDLTRHINKETQQKLLQTHQLSNSLFVNPPALDTTQKLLLTRIKKVNNSFPTLLTAISRQNDIARSTELRDQMKHLGAQVKSMSDDSFQLFKLTNNKIQGASSYPLLWILSIIIFSAVILTSLSLWIYKDISHSLISLLKGFTTATNSDDYDYSTKETGNNEISQVSNLLNEMQRKLERTVRNKQQLQTIVDKQKQNLKKLSQTDPLTQVSNRRAYESRLTKEKALSVRNNISLSLLMIEIDFFREFYVGYGQQTGNQLVKKIADTIQQSLPRKTDFIARYSNDEFVVILPGTRSQGASLVSERIIKEIEKLGIKHEFATDRSIVSVSVGIASLKGRELVTADLLKLAEQAMNRDNSNHKIQ